MNARRTVLAAAAALAIGPASAHAGLELSWGACPIGFGTHDVVFDCANSGNVYELYGTFTVPLAVNNVVGMDWVLDITTASGSLPAFWKMEMGDCNDAGGAGFPLSHLKPPSPTCGSSTQVVATWGASSAITGYGYLDGGNANVPAGPHARILCSIVRVGTINLSPGVNYFGFRISFFTDNASEAGGSCSGCQTPVCIRWLCTRLAISGGSTLMIGGAGTSGGASSFGNVATVNGGGAGCSLGGVTYYRDNDGDGYGASGYGPISCAVETWPVENDQTDCDDQSASVHPGAVEVCNGLDDNCDGRVDDRDPGSPVSIAMGTAFSTPLDPYGVAMGDFNSDSRLDLAVASYGTGSGNTVSVRLATGAPGNFGQGIDYTAGTGPVSVAAGDVNGDGKLDLVTGNYTANTVSVLLGNGAGGFGVKTDFATGTAPYYLAVGDLNGDGKPDLAVPNQSSGNVSVLLNTTSTGAGTPTFAARVDYATGPGAFSAAIGDLNADGRPDLAVHGSGGLSVLLATGAAGSFGAATGFAIGPGVYGGVAVGDLNADGKRDLVVANSGDNTVSVLLNTTPNGAGTPTFAPRTDFAVGVSPFGLALGDLNADGRPDLAVANRTPNTISILPGNGGGGFGSRTDYATGADPFTIAIGDVNGDLKPDLAVVNNDANTVSLLFGNDGPGLAAMIDLVAPASPYGVAVSDLNGDGRLDLAVASYGTGSGNTVSVRLATGAPGNFGQGIDYTAGTGPVSVAAGDVNGDGKLDLVTGNYTANTVSVLLGNGAGGFGVKTDFATGTAPYYLAVGDLNGDGKPDLAVPNQSSGNVSVLLNTTSTGAGTPTFAARVDYATGPGAFSAAIGDLNADGRSDLAVHGSGGLSVLLATGAAGSFGAATGFAIGAGVYGGVAVGDLNADGKRDLVVANYGGNTVSALLNTTPNGAGTPTFAAHTDFAAGTNPWGVALGDMSGDGKPDLVVTNRYSNTVSILPGNGVGGFDPRVDYCVGVEPMGVAIGNLNADGRRDVALVHRGSSTLSVLFNSGSYVTAVEPPGEREPSTFEMLAPRPNPARGEVIFTFTLPRADKVRIEVYDVAGRRVARVGDDRILPPGLHSLTWNGHTEAGPRLRSGFYMVRATVGSGSTSRRFVMMP